MIEHELKNIWQSSTNEERVKFEKSRLILEIDSSLDRMHKAIRFRDLAETVGAAIVIPVFIYYAFVLTPVLTKVASVLIVLFAIFVVIRLKMAKKHQPGAYTVSYLEYLRDTREYLLIQKRLLDTVLYWYIGPCMAFMLLFLIGFIEPGNFTRIAGKAAICLAVGVVVYWFNKRAVKKQIMPRLKKVDELINVMKD